MPISLTDRIRSINRMNGAGKDEEQIEQESEERLVETVEQSWENAKAEEKAKENSVVIKESRKEGVVTLEMLYLEIEALRQTVEMQTEEIKKINKHVNATQKMLKKVNK